MNKQTVRDLTIGVIASIIASIIWAVVSSFNSQNLTGITVGNILHFMISNIIPMIFMCIAVMAYLRTRIFAAAIGESKQTDKLHNSIDELNRRLTTEINNQRNLIETEDSKNRKLLLDMINDVSTKQKENTATISDFQKQINQHKIWLDGLHEAISNNSHTKEYQLELEVLEFAVKQRGFMLYSLNNLNFGDGRQRPSIKECYQEELKLLQAKYGEAEIPKIKAILKKLNVRISGWDDV